MTNTISNQDDVIDSRDVIAKIEELESELQQACEDQSKNNEFEPWLENMAADEKGVMQDAAQELLALRELASEAESSPDWIHGETLIRESYFTDYIEQLIDDCYEMPKEFKSGNWPWRHMTIDFEAAADEAKQDYMEVDFDGETYLLRA